MCGKPQFSGEKTITTLKEVSTLIMGQSPSSDSYNADSNGLPFYQGNADFGEDNPTPRIWCTDPKKIAEKGDILISVRAPIGAINIADEQCCIGRGIAAIRPNTELVSRDYLRHQLCASRDKLEAMGTGSTFKAIGKKALGDFAITIYPKKGQETIACQFNWVAEHIKLANSQLAQLDNLVKSRFVEMFDNSCARVKLSEVCRTYNGDRGKNYPSGNDRVDEGVPFVNAGHLMDGKVSFEKMDYITRERYQLLSGGKIQKGDILYCLRGSLGKCGVADFNEGTIASSMMIVRPDSSKVLTQYLYQVLTSVDIARQLKAVKSGSSQPNLSAKNVAQYLIPLPSIDLQQEFASFVSRVDKLRFDVQQQIDKLELLKNSLMQEYFG